MSNSASFSFYFVSISFFFFFFVRVTAKTITTRTMTPTLDMIIRVDIQELDDRDSNGFIVGVSSPTNYAATFSEPGNGAKPNLFSS